MKMKHHWLFLLVALLCGCSSQAPQRWTRNTPVEPPYLTQLKRACFSVITRYAERDGAQRLIRLDLWQASESALLILTNAQGLEELHFVATDLRTPLFDSIGKISSLKSLSVGNCQLLPEQLKAIQPLKELEELELIFTVAEESSETRIRLLGNLTPEEAQRRDALKRGRVGDHIIESALLTDRALPYLKDLTCLKRLELINTFITAAGLNELKTLTNLEVVDFIPVQLRGETALPFQCMTKLRFLRSFDVDDQVLGVLSEVGSLEDLEVWSGGVTDAGVNHLLKLKKMRRLKVRGNEMTDEGLVTLHQLPELESLDLRYAKKITASGLSRFHTLRPDVLIMHSSQTASSGY